MDPEAPERKVLRSQLLRDLATYLLQEMFVRRIRRRVGDELQGDGPGRPVVGGGDHTLLFHQAQDPVPAFRGRSEGDLALPGSVGRGGVEETGEGSRLREGQTRWRSCRKSAKRRPRPRLRDTQCSG